MSIPFLSFIVPIFMKYSLGISNFLEEISSLSHLIVFLYFFALITEEGFLISPCYSLELCIQMGISFLLCLSLLFFSQLFVRPPQTTILPFCIFLFLGMVLITASCTVSRISIDNSSGTLSNLIPLIYLSLPLYWFRSCLNGLVVFPTFFNLSLNFAIKNSWSKPQLAPGIVFGDCIELLHLWLQSIWFWYWPLVYVHA